MRILILVLFSLSFQTVAEVSSNLTMDKINTDFKEVTEHFSYKIEPIRIQKTEVTDKKDIKEKLVRSLNEPQPQSIETNFEDLENKYFKSSDSISTKAAAPKRTRGR